MPSVPHQNLSGTGSMSNRTKIEERIEKKEQEIQELEVRIREAKAYVQALQDVVKMMPREAPQESGLHEEGNRPRSGSYIADARDAILHAGRPLHVVDILKMAGRKNDRKTRTGMAGSLAAYVRKGDIFTRPRPNTFGLIELESRAPQEGPGVGFAQHPAPSASSGTPKPPRGFGLDLPDDESNQN